MKLMRILLTGIATALLACAEPTGVSAATSAPRAPRVAVTRHVAHIRGQEIPYTAIVAEDFIADDHGVPAAAVVTISYIRADVTDRTRRPVLFAFNGGPGASSSPLHMSAMGPVIRVGEGTDRTKGRLENNDTSPLDVADLVFIDPVSTGFSRAFPGVDPRPWYDGRRDAIEVKTVIADWLETHHRESSPRYLAGESYGTTRAGLILKYGADLRFDGVLLISGGGAASGPHAREVRMIPAMAAGAWYHRRIERNGRSVADIYKEAAQFARTEYAEALSKGDALPAAERHRVAQRLSALIGLPDELIEQNKLRITRNMYMFNLLKDEGLRTGLLDTRVTSPLTPNQQGAIDDPALGVVKPRAGSGPPPTPASIGPVESPVVGRYIREALKFPGTDPYYGVNFTANSLWTFGKNEQSTAQILAAAMKADPQLRLFAVNGCFDLASSDGHGFTQAGVPADRLTLMLLPGPHEVYDGDENRAAFNDAVRRFVTAGPATRGAD